jgi:spermidine synthase
MNKAGLILTSFSLICSGLCCIVDEYILAQLSSNILGNPAHQWPLVIGLMLFATGIGAWLAQFLHEDKTLQGFISVELLLSFLGGYSPLIIMGTYAYFFTHFQLVFYFISFTIGLLIGFEQPLIATINKKFVNFRSNISMTISLDVLGAAIGTFVWIQFLVGKVEIYQAAFMVTLLNLSVALLTYFFLVRYVSEEWATSRKALILIGLTVLIGVTGLTYADDFADVAEQQLYTGKIIHKETTPYQRIVMTKHAQTGDVMMFLNGGLQFCSSDENRYHENLVHPAMKFRSLTNKNKAPLDVLVLGGGDGMAVREIKKYSNINSITLIDLDPAVVKLATENPILMELNDSAFWGDNVHIFNPQLPIALEKEPIYLPLNRKDKNGNELFYVTDTVSVLHQDAYTFIEKVAQLGKKYDVIIIDFPDPRNESLGKLYSKYFFTRINLLLKEGGFTCIQSSSPIHTNHAFLCIGKTMTAAGLNVMPFHDNVPSFNEWGWYLAARQEDNLNLTRIAESFYLLDEFDVETTYLTPKKFLSNTIFGKDILKNADKIEISTLSNPKVYHYYVHYGWKIY